MGREDGRRGDNGKETFLPISSSAFHPCSIRGLFLLPRLNQSHMRFLNVHARFSFLLRALAAAAVVLLVSGVPVAHAQNASATASVTDNNVEPGQPVEYHIQIERRTTQPSAARSRRGWTDYHLRRREPFDAIQQHGQRHHFQLDLHLQLHHRHRPGGPVRHPRAGDRPWQQRWCGPRPWRSMSPAAATARAGAAAGATQTRRMFIELVVPKKTAYVGESIPIEVRCVLRRPAEIPGRSESHPQRRRFQRAEVHPAADSTPRSSKACSTT